MSEELHVFNYVIIIHRHGMRGGQASILS